VSKAAAKNQPSCTILLRECICASAFGVPHVADAKRILALPNQFRNLRLRLRLWLRVWGGRFFRQLHPLGAYGIWVAEMEHIQRGFDGL
jgi:hypothetical protein